MAQELILLSENEEDQEFARAAATSAELGFRVCNLREVCATLETGGTTAVLVDGSTPKKYMEFEKALADSVGLFSDKIQSNTLHFISAQDLEHCSYMVRSPLFGNFIYRRYNEPHSDGIRYGRFLKASMGEKAWGLTRYFPEGVKIQNIPLSKSTQKIEVVEAVKSYLVKAKFQSRMAITISNAVDELVMNAIFTAPVDPFGKPLYETQSRDLVFDLHGKSAVNCSICFDGEVLGFSATDLYGSLDKEKLLQHLSKVYTKEEYRVRTSVAGAGIGLATVFRSGGSLLFMSESSSRTDVSVFFRHFPSYRAFKDQFRFVSTQFYF